MKITKKQLKKIIKEELEATLGGVLNEAEKLHDQEAAAALFSDVTVGGNIQRHISFREFIKLLAAPGSQEYLTRYGYTTETVPVGEIKNQFREWQKEANAKRQAGDGDALVRMRHPGSGGEMHFDVKETGEVLRVK